MCSLNVLLTAFVFPRLSGVLLFVLRVLDAPSGEEEEFGEEFAGEEPGQPEPTGKPPLTLASPF